jgi:2'-5' RNA ligase
VGREGKHMNLFLPGKAASESAAEAAESLSAAASPTSLAGSGVFTRRRHRFIFLINVKGKQNGKGRVAPG